MAEAQACALSLRLCSSKLMPRHVREFAASVASKTVRLLASWKKCRRPTRLANVNSHQHHQYGARGPWGAELLMPNGRVLRPSATDDPFPQQSIFEVDLGKLAIEVANILGLPRNFIEGVSHWSLEVDLNLMRYQFKQGGGTAIE